MQPEPSYLNIIQSYQPACSQCGFLTALSRIEPSDKPGHDQRTFECHACGNIEMMLIKFR
jgi:hypothetical protein